MSRSSALDRVRKLLALASSPNPHEAAAAAARAQALIEAHRLQGWLDAEAAQAADVDPIVDARDAPLHRARRVRKWTLALAVTLAELNDCVAYTLEADDEAIVLIGRGRDREAVAELWTWLLKRIEWLSATHGRGRSRRWHEAFRIGVVDAIGERLRETTSGAYAALDGSALVRVDPARAAHRDALARVVRERLGTGRGRSLRVDATAWRKGREAADELTLSTDQRRR